MKIAFDALWWSSGPPSGRNVIRSLISQWTASYPDDQLECWTDQAGVSDMKEFFGASPNIRVTSAPVAQHFLAIQSQRPDRTHDAVVTQNFTLLRSTPALKCVFYHDALPQAHPEWFTLRERVYLGFAAKTLRHADLVFTSSRSEATRISQTTSSRPKSVRAVGLGLPADFAGSSPERPATHVSPGEFLLTVGRLNVRKNIGPLIGSLRARSLISQTAPLVVVGLPDGLTGGFAQGNQPGLDTLFTGYLPNSQLRWLYENCKAFVFPSLDEGFGLPVLEALACGSRLALSDIPSFREFGDVGTFFDPHSPHSMSTAIGRAIETAQPPTADLSRWSWDAVVARMRSHISASLEAKNR